MILIFLLKFTFAQLTTLPFPSNNARMYKSIQLLLYRKIAYI